MCDSCKEQVKNAELCHFQGKVSCLQCELVFLSNVWINYFGHSFSAMFAVQRSELKWPRNNSLTEPDTLAHIQREIYHFTHRRSSSKCSSVILGQLLQFLLYQVALYTQANILLLPALESVLWDRHFSWKAPTEIHSMLSGEHSPIRRNCSGNTRTSGLSMCCCIPLMLITPCAALKGMLFGKAGLQIPTCSQNYPAWKPTLLLLIIFWNDPFCIVVICLPKGHIWKCQPGNTRGGEAAASPCAASHRASCVHSPGCS